MIQYDDELVPNSGTVPEMDPNLDDSTDDTIEYGPARPRLSDVASIPQPQDPTEVWGAHFDSPEAVTEADVPEDELLEAVKWAAEHGDDGEDGESSTLLGVASFAAPVNPKAKVAFRGGWTCDCVATSLPLVEKDMLAQGLIKYNIDIYQLGYRSDVAASAGTHSKGMMVDVGQYSAAQLKVWWKWGWNMQHRTPAQGFIHHGHGGPYGCTHSAPLAAWQMQQYVQHGRNGLRSNGAADGPTTNLITWQKAVEKYTPKEEEDMPLNNADKAWLREEIRKQCDAAIRQNANNFKAWPWHAKFGAKPDKTARLAMEAIADTVRGIVASERAATARAVRDAVESSKK